MGKVTGFLEYERVEEGYEPVAAAGQELQGVRHRAERRRRPRCRARAAWTAARRSATAAARSTTSFPDFNDLVYRGDWKNAFDDAALDQQLSRVHRPHLPGAVRGGLHARTSTTIRSASSRSSTRSSTAPGPKAGSCRSRRRARPARRSPSSAPARPAWPRRSSWRAPATTVTVFEKNDRIGGLLRYGIPDFKMEKSHIDRRVEQMEAEGVVFRTGVLVGKRCPTAASVTNWCQGERQRR